ncbi:MAG TPA: bifunctional DNA-formamidopyrimidine glycosylase/DNA-(apurinic or apyrimidinic site) lyase [Abditibacteriaceae bacterium]|jgi:formamidopyrimidine-DNA glycosylase
MPELPEAETVRAQLAQQIVGLKVRSAWARLPRITVPDIETFTRELTGAIVVDARRRGKQIYFPLDSGQNLLVHLGMTGRLHVEDDDDAEAPKHVHGLLRFENGRRLVFTDPRTFGRIGVMQELPFLQNMGPEPIDADFDEAALVARLRTRNTKIKAAILDQKLVAGLGNIYADEVCFLAGVHPEQRASDVPLAQLKRLVAAMRPTLEKAIAARGATLKDGGYQDTFGVFGSFIPQVYGNTNEPCATCGTIIQRGVLGVGKTARSYHFCSTCQPLRKTETDKLR